MASRRMFLKTSAAALTVAATRPIFGWQGANDKVRMGVIGMGTLAANASRRARAPCAAATRTRSTRATASAKESLRAPGVSR